jgi:hypothetical protein
MGLNSLRVLIQSLFCLMNIALSAAIVVCMYLACQVARVFTSVSQIILVADPSCVQEITVVPHVLDHVNLDCPDHK